MTAVPPAGATAGLDVFCHYHAPEKVPLLRDAVLPAVGRARRRGLTVHLERHWLHGPHLRIRLYGRQPQVVGPAAQSVADALREHLAAYPSRAAADPAALLDRSALAGRAELVPGPYEPIYPDNTVRIAPADDGHVRLLLGSAAAVERRAELLGAGLAPVAASAELLLDRGNTTHTRVWLTVTAMTVHAAGYPVGLAGGYQSFLSHLQDFLYLQDPDGRVRAGFDREWQRRAELVTSRVGQIATAEGRADDPVARAWADWVAAAREICRPAYERGELPLVPGEQYAEQARATGDPATAIRWDRARRTGYSEYHQLLSQTDFLHLPGVAGHFGPYRFATNVLYLLLTLCDVTPLERYLAAHLVSEAVQRLTGTSWRTALAGPPAARPNTNRGA